MRICLLFLGLGLLIGWDVTAEAAQPEDSVVKVLASVRYPDPLQPWTRTKPEEVAGTGVVIEENRILTSAHLVLYASEVYVQGRAGGAKVEAWVEAAAPGVDLAVLTVKDAKFFAKRPALDRARQLPKAQDTVQVLGFPIGGKDLAVTEGKVARIDYGAYDHQSCGLLIQINAAVNPGNSGGPAVVGGLMIGLVLGRLDEARNIGCVIPNEEIDLFLHDIKDGRYDGKPADATGTEYQRLENEALRSRLKLGPEVKGVLAIPPRCRDASCPFREFDVLTHIDKHEIDNEGMVALPGGQRAPFPILIPQLARDGKVPVTLLRRGERVSASLPVTTQDNRLIRDYQGEQPSYFIHGPLVFSPARAQAVGLYRQMNPILYAGGSPLLTRRFDRVRFPGEELVVVTAPMFPHKIGRGYRDPLGQVVTEVNDVKIKDLRHLVEVLRDSKDEYLTFRFAEEGTEILVFRREEMDKATREILNEHRIAESGRGSEDVIAVWKKGVASPR